MLFNQVATNLHAFPSGCRLSGIISDVPAVQVYGPQDAAISGITTDSRKAGPGWLFAAIAGEHVDGHQYVQRAMEAGAAAVVVQLAQYEHGLRDILTPAYCQHTGTTVIVVHDTREAVAILADRFHASPVRDLKLIGITGTNGKTTVSWLLESILRTAGMKPGLLGTVEYRIGDERVTAAYTTPPAEELHRVFNDMRRAGCDCVVMEVSSHALALRRVYGIEFDVSVFTNLTQDHLDFHGDMQTYLEAKRLLFTTHTRGTALLNADDDSSRILGKGLGRRRRMYGCSGRPAFHMRNVVVNTTGTTLTISHEGKEYSVQSPLMGDFNAYNIAAAFSASVLFGIDPRIAVDGIAALQRVPGRFERIVSVDGVVGVVDYSHTPDSLSKAVATARKLAGDGRVITVFGCGGDRDKGKRPLMGAAATELSDITVITSDNPRSEAPDAIIADIMSGVLPRRDVVVRVHRKQAIHFALRHARPGDIVLVAGKGHEKYQIIGTQRKHFDDSDVIRKYFQDKRGGVL
jgi:UDP-N-acetylmuramoyl-L-alanyl-D-glutamate--2,6-diaminopimelate ligase